MLLTSPNVWGWQYDNFATTDAPPSTDAGYGASITAHASANTKGDWGNISTGLSSATTLANECSFIDFLVYQSTQIKTSALLDIGVDPAGGTSFALVASNLAVGQLPANGITGKSPLYRFSLPLRIPAGASVGARVAASGATGAVFQVGARYYGLPSRPEAVWVGQTVESIGVIGDGSVPTNSDATAITPGTSSSWGSWTSLGAVTKAIKHITLGVQIRDSSTAAQQLFFELGWGHETTPVVAIGRQHFLLNASEEFCHNGVGISQYCNIPAGSTVYVRAVTTAASNESNWSAMAWGVY